MIASCAPSANLACPAQDRHQDAEKGYHPSRPLSLDLAQISPEPVAHDVRFVVVVQQDVGPITLLKAKTRTSRGGRAFVVPVKDPECAWVEETNAVRRALALENIVTLAAGCPRALEMRWFCGMLCLGCGTVSQVLVAVRVRSNR